jgi:molybdopterin molybdotransferase
VRVAETVESKPGMTHFLRVTLDRSTGPLPVARLTGPQGSGILTSVAKADALLMVDNGVVRIGAGEEVDAVVMG